MQGPGDQNNLLSLQGTTDIRIICLKLVELIKFCNKTFWIYSYMIGVSVIFLLRQ